MKLASALLAVLAAGLLGFATSCESFGQGSDSESAEGASYPKPETSLSAAIRSALQKMPDGRCIGAGLGSSGAYYVALVAGSKRRDFLIDAKSGGVIGSSDQALDANTLGMLEELARLEPGVDTVKAVDAALAAESRCWSLAVELGRENGLVYQVLLVRGNKAKVARVSPARGTVLSIEDANDRR
jgi:uncharacterized membrane protein YkoI